MAGLGVGDSSGSHPPFIGLVERLLPMIQEQRGQLVELYLVIVKTVDKLVHEAVRGYLGGGVPNPDHTKSGRS